MNIFPIAERIALTKGIFSNKHKKYAYFYEDWDKVLNHQPTADDLVLVKIAVERNSAAIGCQNDFVTLCRT